MISFELYELQNNFDHGCQFDLRSAYDIHFACDNAKAHSKYSIPVEQKEEN